MVVEMLAWCGAALSCLLCIPQAARTIREERLDGVSACTYWIILANAAVWAAWSLLTGEHAAGAPALVNGPAAVIILRRLLAARGRRNPKLETEGCRAGGQQEGGQIDEGLDAVLLEEGY